MPVAIVASLLGLAAVLIAYYRDAPIAQRSLRAPEWDLLPDPAEVARVEFPVAVPGYDPASVELHFDLLTRAYADLLAAATPEVISRARHRVAVRRGLDPDVSPPTAPAVIRPVTETALMPMEPESANAEALRAEAALAELAARDRAEGGV
jgi:hypothetical protein